MRAAIVTRADPLGRGPSSARADVIGVRCALLSSRLPAARRRRNIDDMSKRLSVGDRVSWNTSQGRTRGRIVDTRTRDFTFDGQSFTASAEEPAYIVASEKSGAEAAHKGAALRRLAS
jgi:hypothetical protein